MKEGDNKGLHEIRECVARANNSGLIQCIERVFTEKPYRQSEIAQLHDDLLYALAYAPSQEVYEGCKTALRLLPELVRPGSLADSGIGNSVVISSFSFTLLKWMNERFHGKITFHSFENDAEDIGEKLSVILPSCESEICSFGYTKTKLLAKLCGGKISVNKIIALFSFTEDARARDVVFSSLGLYVELHLNDTISRSNACAPVHPLFFHDEILKKVDHVQIISKRLPKKKSLTPNQLDGLTAHSRMMLAALGRETDPVTFSNDSETEYYYLDRGLSIALFALKPEKRLAFDSYVGFMMFKNGLPIAYGGAWMFVHRALIGINIFEAYRGGESSYLFAQLLRVYHQRYKAYRFSVEPYQYGKDNPEGISSGAYWFYYRFGFRSDDEKLAAIAEDEQKMIREKKGYRTSAAVLKQFIKSNITLRMKDGDHGIDPAKLSLEISLRIAREFGGDRRKAINHGHSLLRNFLRSEISTPKNDLLRKIFENWCLAFLVLNPKGKAGKKDKFTFVKMLREKSAGTEAEYVKYTQMLKAWLL